MCAVLCVGAGSQVLEVLAAQCVGSNAIAVRSNQNVICERLIRSKLDSLLQTKLIDHCVRFARVRVHVHFTFTSPHFTRVDSLYMCMNLYGARLNTRAINERHLSSNRIATLSCTSCHSSEYFYL